MTLTRAAGPRAQPAPAALEINPAAHALRVVNMTVDSERARYEQNANAEYSSAEQYAQADVAKWESPTGTMLALQQVCADIGPRRVLELGVGTGRYFRFVTGQSYTGVDICEAMLRHAREREPMLRQRGFTSVALVWEEVGVFLTGLPEGAAFDLIFSAGCLGYHVPVTVPLLRDIARALAPGGYLFLQTTQQSWHYRLRRCLRHWRLRLSGKESHADFFLSTSPSGLRRSAAAAGLIVEWIRDDAARFYDRPMLLSLFRRP